MPTLPKQTTCTFCGAQGCRPAEVVIPRIDLWYRIPADHADCKAAVRELSLKETAPARFAV